MTDENKKQKCNCCLFIGIIVLALGLLTGIMGEAVFGLIQILAIIVGIILILSGIKGSKFCKYNK
ncbi:MAG: hypothetical protein KAS66_06920 [Candidatus Omnitrophica bacterium]|nr:hypothetical protein [Candidatus Omnitrophota bacterium]